MKATYKHTQTHTQTHTHTHTHAQHPQKQPLQERSSKSPPSTRKVKSATTLHPQVGEKTRKEEENKETQKSEPREQTASEHSGFLEGQKDQAATIHYIYALFWGVLGEHGTGKPAPPYHGTGEPALPTNRPRGTRTDRNLKRCMGPACLSCPWPAT